MAQQGSHTLVLWVSGINTLLLAGWIAHSFTQRAFETERFEMVKVQGSTSLCQLLVITSLYEHARLILR